MVPDELYERSGNISVVRMRGGSVDAVAEAIKIGCLCGPQNGD